MSQIYKSVSSSPGVPTQFTADDATVAIPVGNNLNVFSQSVITNNSNGIQTTASPNGSDNFYVELTNRVFGTTSTVGAATSNLITFSPTTIGTYSFEFRIAGYNTTSLLGSGASIFGAVRYDGVNMNICDLFDEINNDEGAMSGTDIAVVSSGANMILQVTGYLGQTINWSAVGLYTFAGA